MCGFLAYEKTPSFETLDEHLTLNSHRGMDSFGLVDSTGWWVKSLSFDVLEEDWGKVEGPVLFHHRLASVGGVTIDLAHPIEKGHALVLQNGTKKSLLRLAKGASSDTEALARYLSTVRSIRTVRRLMPIILDGAGVVFFRWKDRWFFHKDESRSLWATEHDEFGIVLASEPVFEGAWFEVENTEELEEANTLKELMERLYEQASTGRTFKKDTCSECMGDVVVEVWDRNPHCYWCKKATTPITPNNNSKEVRNAYSFDWD